MELSLVTIYRRRAHHLQTLLQWWQHHAGYHAHYEWIVVEADTRPTPGLAQTLQQHQVRYDFLPNCGTLHKTRALNRGLQLAQGRYAAPLDVDLIPYGEALACHHLLATLSEELLITGYRLMSPQTDLDVTQLPQAIEQAAIAPEAQPTALRKHLLRGEKFGVMPFFCRQRLLDIQGWDEAFIGWGAEDQDLIERYLGQRRTLCRSAHFCFLHLQLVDFPQGRYSVTVASNLQTYNQIRQVPIVLSPET